MSDPNTSGDPEQDPSIPSPEPRPSHTPATRHRLLRATAAMASGSIVSRLLGFIRNFLMGVIVVGTGTGVSTAVSAANFLPNTIWIFVGGGVLNAILVPAIVRAVERPDRGSDYISRLMTLVMTGATVLTVVCIALVPVLVLVSSGDLQGPTLALAIQLGFWMMPQIIFSAMYVLCGQLLNAHDSFGPYQWAPVMNNVVGILGAVAFLAVWGSEPDPTAWTLGMIIAFASFNVGGSAAQVAFLLVFVRKLHLHLRPRWGFRGLGLGKLGRIGLWTLAMLGVAQLGIFATRWSTIRAQHASAEHTRIHDALGAAQFPSLFALDSSYMAFMIPQGIIGVALVTAAFPSIARSASRSQHADVLHTYSRTSRLLAVPMVLASILFIGLSAPIMFVIVGGTSRIGAQANGLVLAGYMMGLLPFALTYLIKRVCYAYENSRAPFWMQVPNTLVSLLAIWPILQFVDPRWAAATATLVSSFGNLTSWVLGSWLLSRSMRKAGADVPERREGLIALAKLLFAGAVALGVGLGLSHVIGDAFWINRPVAVALGGGVGLVMTLLFVALAWLLRVEELRDMIDTIGRRLRRRAA